MLEQHHLHRAIGQVGLALEVERLHPAAAAHAGQPGRRPGGLHNLGGEVEGAGLLGALPGALHCLLGGQWRRGLYMHRQAQGDDADGYK